jgi:4-amino-4-deoxy-L-arabinose transferase-like glycosyltransferase
VAEGIAVPFAEPRDEPDTAVRARRRPPVPLLALLVTALVLGVLWAALIPAYQSPDEQSHFGAVQSLGERFALPGDPARRPFSSESDIAGGFVNVNQVAGQAFVKPEWSEAQERRWRSDGVNGVDAPRNDGGGPNTAALNPPAFYAWDAIAYTADSAGDFFDRLFAARLFSMLWLPVTVLGTWLLTGELLGRRRVLQFTAAALPALAPMVVFISASVNPDGMLYALASLALWLGVRCARRGMDWRHGAGLFAAVGLACTVKATAYAFLPAALAVAVMELLRRRGIGPRHLLRIGLTALVPLALTLGVWLVLSRALGRAAAPQVAGAGAVGSGTNIRELLSYVWQYYLPRLPFMTPYPNPAGIHPWFEVWVKQGTAAFGWLEVRFPDPVYTVVGLAVIGALLATLLALWRARRQIPGRVAVFVVLFAGGLLAGLHWTDYHQLEAGSRGFMQGRYLFPLIGLGGAALAAIVALLPRRWQPTGAATVVGLVLVLQVLSLGLVAERFYA